MSIWLTTSRWWLVVIAVAFALRLPAFNDRFYSNDEATYSAIAAKLAAGGTMYVDAVDHKPPGIAWLYTGMFRVAGVYRMRWIRVLLAATVALTGIAVGELASGLTGQPLARVAGLLYVALSATGFAPNTQAANTELFANLPLTLAALAMFWQSRATRVVDTWAWALAAGIATAAATLFRYQVAVSGIAWLLSLAIPRRSRHPFAAASGLAVGFGGAAALLVAGFWLTGHLDSFLFWGWRYNFQYIAAVPIQQQMIRFAIGTLPIVAAWLPALILLAFAWDSDVMLAWVWLATMVVAFSVGGRFFGNYFLVAVPPLAVLAGRGLMTLDAAGRRRLLVSLTTGIAWLAMVSALAVVVWDRLDVSAARLDAAYRDAGDWIGAHSNESDRIFVWGDSAQIYVYSRRLMSTRFAFTNYHAGVIWGTNAIPGSPHPPVPSQIVPRAWRELLADLKQTPPALIADAGAGGLHEFEGEDLEKFEPLRALVRAEYRYETTTRGGIRLYRRIHS
ncbi:MAG TPA: glycosyltransferase family 39 protein [Vicinamibacterales bacterium]|nr:glycosyltransferase family 39 protein [Vicinamibacterales bacterium]